MCVCVQRALELIAGMVTRKNLSDCVQRLMEHVENAEGTYRDALIEKIIFICSRDKYEYLEDFAWYISTLIKLAYIQVGIRAPARVCLCVPAFAHPREPCVPPSLPRVLPAGLQVLRRHRVPDHRRVCACGGGARVRRAEPGPSVPPLLRPVPSLPFLLTRVFVCVCVLYSPSAAADHRVRVRVGEPWGQGPHPGSGRVGGGGVRHSPPGPHARTRH